MGAALDDAAVLQDEDEVGGADGGEAVGDHDRGPAGEGLGQGGLDGGLGGGVEVGGGLVQDDDAGAGEEEAGDRQALALAAGEAVAALADDGVEAIG